MRAVDLIRKKRDGGELTPDEVAAFVAAATHGHWPDYQLSALLMAVCVRGMTPAETATLKAPPGGSETAPPFAMQVNLTVKSISQVSGPVAPPVGGETVGVP